MSQTATSHHYPQSPTVTRKGSVPKLVSIDDVQPLMSRQGQPMAPMVSADLDGTATTLLSAGVIRMKRGHASRAHRHDGTDVIVLLWKSGKSGALTVYGDRLENEIWQRPSARVVDPEGCAARRNQSQPLHDFRSNPVLGEDNRLLEDLEPIVDGRRQAFGVRRFPWRERRLAHMTRR